MFGSLMQNIGAFLKPPAVTHFNIPLAAGAATRTSTVLDRTEFDSCRIFLVTGAATGSPDAVTADLKLRQSASSDGSSPSDVTSGSVTQLTSLTSGISYVDIDLRGAKQYVFLSETVTLTGGSSPKLPIVSGVIFGGSRSNPAA